MNKIFWLLFVMFVITAGTAFFVSNINTIVMVFPLVLIVLIGIGYFVKLKK